jgi:hypothetical protein
MADPATLGLVALGVGIVGTGLSAYSQYQAGAAQKEAYDYNAEIVQQKAAYDEAQARDRLRKLMSTQRALYAKAGVDLTSGSPLLVLAQTAAEGEEEALNIRRTGYNEAQLQKYYGSQAKTAGTLGAGSTLLTGLGNLGLAYGAGKSGVTVVGGGK